VRAVRRQLYEWWNGLPADVRDKLLEHRGCPIPNQYRAALGRLEPLGVAVYADATSSGSIRLHPLISAYLELRATQGAS
jgi:hypothetical protein